MADVHLEDRWNVDLMRLGVFENLRQLKNVEIAALKLLHWNTFVSTRCYAEYEAAILKPLRPAHQDCVLHTHRRQSVTSACMLEDRDAPEEHVNIDDEGVVSPVWDIAEMRTLVAESLTAQGKSVATPKRRADAPRTSVVRRG